MLPQKVLPEKMNAKMKDVHEWASKQFDRAAVFLRSISMAASRDEDLLEEITQQVQASDGYFFEQFSKSPEPEEDPPGQDNQLTIVKLSINDNNERLHDLYVETLYTIVHKIGRSSLIPESQLIRYAKEAFQIDGQFHQKLMDKAMKEKPPIVLLNVHLLEARDLIAKDINGFSDPFAMMGIIPDKRRISENGDENSDNDHDDDTPGTPISPNHQKEKQSNMLRRFGGSFRRRKGSQKVKHQYKGIPAKLIKASSVQNKTLNPKWNEKFQFIVDDVNKDMFHLDIWDHDDEDRSVLDAVASLNQVSGLKGFGRYFKEITQSARASDSDLVDDFLGSVTLKIRDIPSAGLEDWFTLEKRSEKSEVSGKVKLKLWLSTREERSDEVDDLIDVKQHIELIRQFALQEIRISGAPVSFYQGNLPETATTILHQHAIQGDLTELHQAMCHWLAYSAMLNIGISYAFLYDILSKLISLWAPLALDKDEENMLGESFINFDSYCKNFLLEHRQKVNVKKRNQVDGFANMIRCLKLLRDSPLYSKCVIYQKSFDEDLNHIIRESADKYFHEKLREAQNDESPCIELNDLVRSLVKACQKFSNFDPIFKSYAGMDYSDLTYREFDRLLNDYITSEMMSEKKKDLKTHLMSVPEDEATLNLVLKVHFALAEFKSFRMPKQKYRLDNLEWDTTFDRAIYKWMDIARTKAFARVDLACQLDAQIQLTGNEVRHTSSYVDVCHIIEQMISAWERMQVKDVCLRSDLTEKLVVGVCKIAEYYVDRVMAQLATDGFCGQLQPFLPPALVNIFCAAINNCEQVRRSLALAEKLRLDELLDAYKLKTHKEPKWKTNIEKDLETCEKYIGEQIDCTVDRFSRRQISQLKKHVFHLAWSPSACPVDQSLKPLTDMLDSELSSVHRSLLHRNFIRVMHSQVNLILQLFQECISENPGLEPSFYQRLYDAWAILMDFFHAGGKGISLETFEHMQAHKNLLSQLSLNQMPTIKLIEQYYKDLLKEQNEATECKYGILNIRAYYNTKSQTLVVDVIGAKQIIPLDTNGLSDPFVVIELVPRQRYANIPVAKSKVVYKTLNPIFDETFEFHISPKLPPSAMVHFVVMDHDFLRTNDFAGEALLDLSEVPGFGSAGGSTLRQFNLVLIHPNQNATAVLESRKEDKEAQEFVKSMAIAY